MIDVIVVLFLAAVLVVTAVFLFFPKSYEKVHRHLRPDALEFDNTRPNRERQLAMIIIALVALASLVESSKCSR